MGFIEAEGSFYLTLKGPGRLVHGFGVTLKLDKIVLSGIKEILQIEAQVKSNSRGFFSLDSTNLISLNIIKDFFMDTMKSRKSLEFKIWVRSFRDKGKYDKLLKVKKIIERIRDEKKLSN